MLASGWSVEMIDGRMCVRVRGRVSSIGHGAVGRRGVVGRGGGRRLFVAQHVLVIDPIPGTQDTKSVLNPNLACVCSFFFLFTMQLPTQGGTSRPKRLLRLGPQVRSFCCNMEFGA